MHPGLRIVLTGPESTGKSALTAALADALHLPAAQEYARIHLEKHGPSYDYDMLLALHRLHRTYQREQVPPTVPAGLFDTDLINYKIWCDVVFGQCHPEIIAHMQAETSHVYLLCYPDIPWEPDPLREHPDERLMLFDRHLAEIQSLGRPYVVIRGLGEARVTAARAAVLALTGL